MAADTLGARSDEPAESAGESTCQLPVSARVCVCFGVIQLISSSFVLLQFGTGGLVTAADPAELKWFHSATAMLLPAMLLEVAGSRLSSHPLTCFLPQFVLSFRLSRSLYL